MEYIFLVGDSVALDVRLRRNQFPSLSSGCIGLYSYFVLAKGDCYLFGSLLWHCFYIFANGVGAAFANLMAFGGTINSIPTGLLIYFMPTGAFLSSRAAAGLEMMLCLLPAISALSLFLSQWLLFAGFTGLPEIYTRSPSLYFAMIIPSCFWRCFCKF